MNIKVNHKELVLSDEATVQTLAETLRLPLSGAAIAIGQRVIPRAKWEETPLSEGDEITVISATYGG